MEHGLDVCPSPAASAVAALFGALGSTFATPGATVAAADPS